MFRKSMLQIVCCSAMLLETATAADRAFTFITVDYPGAILTQAEGISPEGDIVGLYADTSKATHGFLLHDGLFTTIDYPGAVYSDARAISPQGQILGNYSEDRTYVPVAGAAPVSLHGFVRATDGSFSPVAPYPGHMNMIAQRILPDGSVVGCFHDNDFGYWMRGFVLSRKGYSGLDGSLDGLDVPMSMNNGATPGLGQITGFFTEMGGRTRSYVIQNGTKTNLDCPGSSRTRAWDMSPSGNIVGDYACADSKACGALGVYGFLREKGASGCTTLAFPSSGMVQTQARGINSEGTIVGWYQDAAGVHGFVAVPIPEHRQ
jgi:uncharacterized membrane protein